MCISTFLEENTFLDHLKFTLPLLAFVNFITLIFYKRVSRFLKKEGVAFYILVRSLYIGCFSFLWVFVCFALSYHGLSSLRAEEITLSTEINSICFGLLLVFSSAVCIETTKKLFLEKRILGNKISRKSIRKAGFLLQLFVFFWFLFLVESAFLGYLNDSVIKKVLTAVSILCFALVLAYIARVTANSYTKRLKNKKNIFVKILLKAGSTPFISLFVIGVLLYILQHYIGVMRQVDYPYIIGAVFLITLFRFVSLAEKQLVSGRWSNVVPNKTVVQGLGNVARAVLILPGILFLWNAFSGKKMAITGLGTILGGTGLGLTLAAQPIGRNYFSGLVLSFQGNFKVGDWIYFTDGSVEGSIEQIGAISTAIRTIDKRLLFLPNAYFSSKSIVNVSAMTHRRILQTIPIGWITNLQSVDNIIQEIRMVVYNHPGIDKTQKLMVHLTKIDKTNMEITIAAFTKTKDLHTYFNVQENILRETKNILEKYRVAPPAQMLYPPLDI